MVPLDSVKGTLRLSSSLLPYLLGRRGCLDHGLHPCIPTSGRRARSLIFCLNHLTHRWLKRPLILDFRKPATSSCREGADIHLLTTVLSRPCPGRRARCWERLAGGPEVRLGWEGARRACRHRVRDLPLQPPSLRRGVLDSEGTRCHVPGTFQAAPSQCMSLVPCPSTSLGRSAASFPCRSLWSGAARFSRGCCCVGPH